MPSPFSYLVSDSTPTLPSGTTASGQRVREQLFRIVDILPAGIDALVAARPGAARHIYAGRYGDLIAGWGAQADLCRARLASELIAVRLKLATGRALEELAASEYWASRDSAPTNALGNVTIQRTVVNTNPGLSGNFTPGEVRAGHRFRKVADPTLNPAVEEAEYETIAPTIFGRDDNFEAVIDQGGGNYLHGQSLRIALRATRAGPHANTPFIPLGTEPEIQSVDTFFDPTFTVDSSLLAAGGSLNVLEDTLRQFARAMKTGFFGPTTGALVAGAFSFPGVAHVDVVEDPTIAVTRLFVADESWASSVEYAQAIERHLNNDRERWVGFGTRFRIDLIENQLVTISCNVMLRDRRYFADQPEITEKIRKKVVDYFDNRPKWWAFRLNALGGVIGGADHRIMACTSVSVFDRESGSPLAEPALTIDPENGFARHYMVANDAVKVTYAGPS